jgi:hypothetical protein
MLIGLAVKYEYDVVSKRGFAVVFDLDESSQVDSRNPDSELEQQDGGRGASRQSLSQSREVSAYSLHDPLNCEP